MEMNKVWIVKVSFLRPFLRSAEESDDRNLAAFLGDVSKNMIKEVHAQTDTFGKPQVLYILNRGLVSKATTRGGRVLHAGDVWGLDFVLTDSELLDPPDCFALTYVECMALRRDIFMQLIEERESACPMVRSRVRKFTVRLAIQRGILLEAKARIQAKRLAMEETSSCTTLDVESVEGFAIRGITPVDTTDI